MKVSKAEIRRERHFADRVVKCFVDRPRRIMDALDATMRRHADRTALVDGARRLSFGQLDRHVACLAAQLRDLGLAAGDRVALVIPNRAEFAIALLAAWRLGAVPVPINTREAAPETAYILDDCKVTGLIFDPAFPDAIPAPGATPSLAWRLSVDAFQDTAPAPVSVSPQAGIDEDDLACILYTSGTTGHPKGAMLTHLGIIHSMRHYARHLELGPGDTALLVVPATHITGLIGLVIAALGLGMKLVMMQSFATGEVIRIAEQERMTYTVMVPAMYNLLLLREDLSKHDLRSWRVGAYGGAVMPPEAIAKLAAFLPGLNLVNAYGATETTSPTCFVPLGSDPSVFDTIGRPVACAEVVVMNGDGRECPPGEVGEFWIRGPMVIPGYWGRPEANAADFVNGFWRSGDIGEMTEDGFLRMHDRAKDLVNRGGYKVFSSEVENVLLKHGNVVEAAVVPRPCPVLGERVHAFVHLKTPMADPGELIAHCAAELSDYKVPETFTLMDGPLPRNANGKVLKRKLRESLL